MPKIECAYCMHDVDDASWAEEATEHAATCEWVQTRAHRKPAAQVGA